MLPLLPSCEFSSTSTAPFLSIPSCFDRDPRIFLKKNVGNSTCLKPRLRKEHLPRDGITHYAAHKFLFNLESSSLLFSSPFLIIHHLHFESHIPPSALLCLQYSPLSVLAIKASISRFRSSISSCQHGFHHCYLLVPRHGLHCTGSDDAHQSGLCIFHSRIHSIGQDSHLHSMDASSDCSNKHCL